MVRQWPLGARRVACCIEVLLSTRSSLLLATAVGILPSACAPTRASRSEAARVEAAREAAATEPGHTVATLQPAAPPLDFRSAARSGRLGEAAAAIDALPEAQRSDPGTRYVRAFAARRLGDCERALSELSGLSGQLPLLEAEIESMTRECELVVGSRQPAASALRGISPQSRLDAARSAMQAGALERAKAITDALCTELGSRRSSRARELFGQARELRAELAERLGLEREAQREYRWLALHRVSPGADLAHERLSGRRLSSGERLRRAEILADRGQIAGVERELELARAAPGSPPSPAVETRTRARAHFRSRASYADAARLYEEATQLPGGARTSDFFYAASAWVRSGELERGVGLYDAVMQKYPGSRAWERAAYRKAQALYAAGRWDAAVEAYDTYLRRYGKRPREARFLRKTIYERALSELARGNGAAALEGYERLRRFRSMGYSERGIALLESIALASSGNAELESRAAERFEQLAKSHPLSFVALASAARLRQMGREPPRLAPPPTQVIAADLPSLPDKVQLLLDLGLDSAAERALHEAEPELRAEFAPRAGRLLCEQYGWLDRGHRRYALAASLLRPRALSRPPTPDNVWAWQCAYPRPFAAAVANLERRHGLPEGLVHAVMRQESAFRPDVRSPAGAVGLMQLMPRTAELAARELSVEHQSERLTRPSYNLELGAFYLSKLLRSFERRPVLALAGYNAGPHSTSRWVSGGAQLASDLWAARIPYEETRRYVARVMESWARYRYLAGKPLPELELELPTELELPRDSY